MSESTDSFALDIEVLLENGVGSLLQVPEIAGTCKGWLKNELGCNPPLNHALYFCFRKALEMLSRSGSTAVGSRLLILANRNEYIGRLLGFLADASRQAKDRGELKSRLLKAYVSNRSDDELEADGGTPLPVLIALRHGQILEGLGQEFEDLLAEIRDEQQQLLSSLTGIVSAWDRNEHARQSAVTSIKYNAGIYPLVGRDQEIDILNSFLGDLSLDGPDHRFRWLCMTGEGGEGKTRLAFDYVTQLLPENWIGGLLRRNSLEKLNVWQNWLPQAPTLFVIDYPAQNPKLVGEVLEIFRTRNNELSYPVRILLLERSTSAPWYDEMLGEKASSDLLKNHIFRRSKYEMGWELPPLDPVFVVQLMGQRFELDDLPAPSPSLLYEAAGKADPRSRKINENDQIRLLEYGLIDAIAPDGIQTFPRAIFAVAYAELAVRQLKQKDVDVRTVFSDLNREDVLDEIVKRERVEIWKSAIPDTVNDRDGVLIAHENLLALATLMRGLTLEHLRHFSAATRDYLPDQSPRSTLRWNAALISRMGSGTPEYSLPGLEPDILGEYHFFSVFRKLPKNVKQSFLEDAYTQSPDQSVLTLSLMCRDFPEEFLEFGMLRPNLECSPVANRTWMGALITITFYYSISQNHEAVYSALEAAFQITRQIPDSDEIALLEMSALYNGASHTGKHQDWGRLDHILARAAALQAMFPGDAEIALEEMSALYNGALDTGMHQDWGRLDGILTRAAALQAMFPGDVGIALEQIRAFYNRALHTGMHQDWERLDRILLLNRAGFGGGHFL